MQAGSVSLAGMVRQTNEDSCAIISDLGLFVVADGMGGHLAGEVASDLAVQTLISTLRGSGNGSLRDAVAAANAAVYHQANTNKDQSGMGTTLTAVLLSEEGGEVVHVGDSRAYLMSLGTLVQLTDDHSCVGEMLRQGMVSPEEAREHPHKNILTRALGTSREVVLDNVTFAWGRGDQLLLCTDGIIDFVSDGELVACLQRLTIDEALQDMVALVMSRGAPDNVTAVLVRNV